MACRGSYVLDVVVLGCLGKHWLAFWSISALLAALRAEIPDRITIGAAMVAVILFNLTYVPFFWPVLDHDWSFEPHRATRRLKLFGISVWERTYEVIDATDRPDRLVLRTADLRDTAVCSSVWDCETDVAVMPPELSRLIRTYLALPSVGGLPDRAEATSAPGR